MNIFDLAAKISLNSGGFTKGVDAAKKGMGTLVSGVASGTQKIEQLGSTAMKAYTGLATAVATGVGTLVKLSTESYGSYEQLVGGVETLFGAGGKSLEEYAEAEGKTVAAVADKYDALMRAQKNVLDAAAGAYKTAGLSANEYIETVTGFSASLLQSLGGDTEKAAEYADMAITDMSDNANKMGTDMSLIQNAYQGFAKANYTMLDNLKLGYGGTKTEMQRLIEDAAELDDSVDASSMSFDNIVRAIHAVQTEMGITGTTAKEAATTIQGSAASMKGAWQNWLTVLSKGTKDSAKEVDQLTDQLLDSVEVYADNLLPRIENAFDSLVFIVEDRTEEIGELAGNALLTVANKAPAVISTATNVIRGVARELVARKGEIKDAGLTLFNSFLESFEDIADEAMPLVEEFVPAIAEGFISYKSTLFAVGVDIIMAIANGVSKDGNAKKLADKLASAVTGAVGKISDNLDDFLNAGMTILVAIGDGIIDNSDLLIDSAFDIVDKLLEFISNKENAKTIATMAVTILSKFATGIGDNLDELIPAAADAVTTLALELTTPENLGKLLDAAFILMQGLAIGTLNALPTLLGAIPQIGSNLSTSLETEFDGISTQSVEWGEGVGNSFLEGLLNGLRDIYENTWWQKNVLKPLQEGFKKIPEMWPQSLEDWGNFAKGGFYDESTDSWLPPGEISKGSNNQSDNNIDWSAVGKPGGLTLGNDGTWTWNSSGVPSNPFVSGLAGNAPYAPPVASTKTDGTTYEDTRKGEAKTVTIGDVTIVIDGSKFEDEQELAEYTAKALQDLYERRESIYD